jgi:hypothetical protein
VIDVLKKIAIRKLREVFTPADINLLYSVEAWLWTLEDMFTQVRMKRLLSIITSHDLSLRPNIWKYDDEKIYSFTTQSLDSIIKTWQEEADVEPDRKLWVYLENSRRGKVWYKLEPNQTEEFPFSTVGIYTGDYYFRDKSRTDIFLHLLEKLYYFCKAEYLICSHDIHLGRNYLKPLRRMDGNIPTFWMKPANHLPAIGWLTIFGPRYAQLIDPRVESVSAYVKRMDDGGIMLLTSPSPLRYGEKDTVRCEKELKQVLPKELFFNPANPAGPYLSPDYPRGCKEWLHRDEFEGEVEIHLKTSGSIISNIRLLHRPSGISVSKDVEGQDINVLERELMVDLRRRIDDAGTLK